MIKKPFVTKEQVEEIVKTYPTPFTFMMRKDQRKCKSTERSVFPGIRDIKSILP